MIVKIIDLGTPFSTNSRNDLKQKLNNQPDRHEAAEFLRIPFFNDLEDMNKWRKEGGMDDSSRVQLYPSRVPYPDLLLHVTFRIWVCFGL